MKLLRDTHVFLWWLQSAEQRSPLVLHAFSDPENVFALDRLSLHHRDPFDRMLVAQASVEGFTHVTRDPKLQSFGVPTLW